MSALPPPFTPPDCDVQDLPFMQWEVVRFLKSDLVTSSTKAEGFAAVLLWNEAWLRVPAASMPDDDRILAKKADCTPAEWRKLKAGALRGWVRCADGMLYHPVVAEKALDAWLGRLEFRKRSAIGNAKKYGKPFDPAPFDTQIAETKSLLAAILARTPSKDRTRTPSKVSLSAPKGEGEYKNPSQVGAIQGLDPDSEQKVVALDVRAAR